MIVLVDMDGVLADFEQGFFKAWQLSGHAFPAIDPLERRNFYIRQDYPLELRSEVEAIYTAEGFYRNLAPIDGCIEAMQTMLADGLDVRICTSPLNQYRNCVLEKYEWVERELGTDFVARMIVTKDKTLVHGQVLIDDNPHITGAVKPQWSHIVFEQPYNRHLDTKSMRWHNWREVLAACV